MKMNNRLSVDVTRIITLGTILFAAVVSTAFFFYTRAEQQNIMRNSIEQLFMTVKPTAMIAAYLGNKELATEVVDSLSKNDIVSSATFTNTSGIAVTTDTPYNESGEALFFPLHNPFDESEQVGEIQIQPNEMLLNQYAKNAALKQVLIQLTIITAVAVFALIVLRRVLTTPIQLIASSLHRIKPGEAKQLTCPKGHEKNEIGNLVIDINKLLESTHRTIEQEKLLRTQVENMEKHFRLIFEHASAGIFLLDDNFYLTSSNMAFKKIAGIVAKERRENKKNIYLPDLFSDSKTVHKLLRETLETDRQLACDLRLNVSTHSEERWLHCLFSTVHNDQETTMIEGLVIDVTERTFQMERILFESEHDPLTRTFNRRGGEQLLNILLTNAQREDLQLVLMLIDLDGFKEINDNFGHDAGDTVLMEVANRMQKTIRKEDILIRMGGDEFIIAFTAKHQHHDEIDAFVKKLQNRFNEKIQLNCNEYVAVGLSIGIAIFPHNGMDIDTLIANADTAMYQSKRRGKNCASYYLAA